MRSVEGREIHWVLGPNLISSFPMGEMMNVDLFNRVSGNYVIDRVLTISYVAFFGAISMD